MIPPGANAPRKILFMHIAKAAGSSVNSIFHDVLGKGKCIDHVEWHLLSKSLDEIITDKTYMSGHVYFNLIEKICAESNAVTFTLIREPYSHITSHILWLAHYALPDYAHEYAKLNQDIRTLVDMIAETNLMSPYELDRLMHNLTPWGLKLLNNCQSRYLLGQPDNYAEISLDKFPKIKENLSTFDSYGTVENMAIVINDVFKQASIRINESIQLSKKINTRKAKLSIDLDNPLARGVLQRHILTDLHLYNWVRMQEVI